MHDRLNDPDIEAILRGDAEVEVGLAEFLTRVRSSAEWTPDPETISRHVTAAANAVTPTVVGGVPGQPVAASEPAMKGIRLKFRTLTRSALTWIVAGTMVLLGTTGALAAANHLPQQSELGLSNAASKMGRDVSGSDDLSQGVTDVEEPDEEDQIPVVTSTVPDDIGDEQLEDTAPDDQTGLIIVDQTQNQTTDECVVEDQEGSEVEDTEQIDQRDGDELDGNESDQPDDDCEVEDQTADDQDQAGFDDVEHEGEEQVSDVDDNEVESNDQTEDTEIEDPETNDEDHQSTDSEEHESGEHESDQSTTEEGGD